jgi:hypothetical protein
MYKEIIEYARRENLLDMDFEMKNIHWTVQLDKEGKKSGPAIHNVESVLSGNGKSKEVIIPLLVPYTDPNYISICTNPEYYFLVGQSKVLLGEDDKDSSREKLEYVQQLLKNVGSHSHFKSISKFLGSKREKDKVLADLKEQKMKPTDWFTFMVDGKLVIKNEEVKSLWREYRKNNNTRVNNTPRFCHITGQMTPCVDKPTKISFLPKIGAVDLVGLGQDSYHHCGIDGLTIGIEEDNRLKWGLYDLCKRGTLYGKILYIHWSKEKTSNDLFDLLNCVDPLAVSTLLQSPVKGEEYDLLDNPNQYYLYGLSVRSGRLEVVEQHVMSLNEVQRNIKSWFEKMGDKKYSIYQLIKTIEKVKNKKICDSEGQTRHIWRNLYRELLMSAILNRPISQEILSRAIDLELMNQVVSDKCNPTRMCLIGMGSLIDVGSIYYKYGSLVGKYSNLHRLTMVSSGNTGKNYVSQMLRGLVNQPRYSFEILSRRFSGLRKFYTKKVDEKFPGRGTQLYDEITNAVVSIPETLYSTQEKSSFLSGLVKETQQRI